MLHSTLKICLALFFFSHIHIKISTQIVCACIFIVFDNGIIRCKCIFCFPIQYLCFCLVKTDIQFFLPDMSDRLSKRILKCLDRIFILSALHAGNSILPVGILFLCIFRSASNHRQRKHCCKQHGNDSLLHVLFSLSENYFYFTAICFVLKASFSRIASMIACISAVSASNLQTGRLYFGCFSNTNSRSPISVFLVSGVRQPPFKCRLCNFLIFIHQIIHAVLLLHSYILRYFPYFCNHFRKNGNRTSGSHRP